jgi:UDP-N-acetylmuramoyl-tripeptide--D-alanyl-D-alanine ligase
MGTVQAVAEENGSVFAHVRTGGWAVFPSDEPYTELWRGLAAKSGLRTLTFGAGGDVQATGVWQGDAYAVSVASPQGGFECILRMPGAHNLRNAAAVTACALCAGVPAAAIAQGLSHFEAVKGRSRVLALQHGSQPITLVDDSYNANPDSVRAAIAVLATLAGPQCLVLGDMGEVGDQGPQFHAEVGDFAARSGIARLLAIGTLSAHAALAFNAVRAGATHFEHIDGVHQALSDGIAQWGSVLIKGSRFMAMERAVAHVQNLCAPAAGDATSPQASHAA